VTGQLADDLWIPLTIAAAAFGQGRPNVRIRATVSRSGWVKRCAARACVIEYPASVAGRQQPSRIAAASATAR